MNNINIAWHKTNSKAIIPTKRNGDAGFDLYTTEDNVVIYPHQKHLFATGLQVSVTPSNYWLMVVDRGSTGSKGLHVHCGIIDNSYHGEIFVCLNNDNDFPVYITSQADAVKMIDNPTKHLDYPSSKAIAQVVIMKEPISINSTEVDDDNWEALTVADIRERGSGKLGSSGK